VVECIGQWPACVGIVIKFQVLWIWKYLGQLIKYNGFKLNSVKSVKSFKSMVSSIIRSVTTCYAWDRSARNINAYSLCLFGVYDNLWNKHALKSVSSCIRR
jgi:hypothetical protein